LSVSLAFGKSNLWRSPISTHLNQFEWFDGIAGLEETVAVARVDQQLTLIDIDLQLSGAIWCVGSSRLTEIEYGTAS
jgi:hypothetical protein